MPLSPGTRLGPYEIVALLGEGGMGEVYRARDPRLNRDVAIKTSREQFNDRFEREARAVAALNHPNICHLYDIGPNYLVMELVEGETLKGPLPVDQVLAIARQVALALEAAHEKGIVHRDLKPANIKITPEGVVKVLDFGLARLAGADLQDPTESPTTMASPTRIGTILGTAAYMAPEQARGKTVDKRADIWAFGVVLYEISTGDKLFAGETVSDTLAQVLMKEPDLARLPSELDRIVRWCLEKDPAKRLRDIGDARPFLAQQPQKPTAVPAPIASSASGKGIRVWQASAVAAILAAAGVAAVHLREQPPPAPDAFRFELRLPANALFTASSTVVLSPDGRHVTFSGLGPEGPQVFVQDFDGGEARALKGTRIGPQAPPFFWSPDSRYVVFSENSPKLSKVDILTGAVQDICDKPGPPIGGSWNRDDTIVFGSTTTGLWRVSAGGGKPVPLTHLDTARQERSHELPMFLPDGRHFVYLANSADPAQSAIYAGSLDDAPGKPRQKIVSTEFGARFVQGRFVPGRFVPEKDRGWLLYLRGGSLMAQPFDTEKLALTGNPSPLPVRVGTAYQTALFSASSDLLVYRAGGSSRSVQFNWVDAKSGKATGTVGEPAAISSAARISPDETRVAYAKEGADGRTDIWVLDLARGGSAKLTFGGGESDYPVWSPDGRELAFGRLTGGIWQIFRKKADGTGAEEPVLRTAKSVHPVGWSKDGRFLTYSEASGDSFNTDVGMGVLPLEQGAAPIPLFSNGGKFLEGAAQFSPDGRYIAYHSNETGRFEIYVRSFSPVPGGDAGGKWLVSSQGGRTPQWSADGRKLIWVSLPPIAVMAAEVDTSHGFHAGVPEQLYAAPTAIGGASTLTSRGQGLLLIPVEQHVAEPISVMVNWLSALKP